MNPVIQLKTASAPLLIAFVLACFALSPTAQAVVPPPDGGYPGGNTAEGQDALFTLTTGGFNTAIGWLSLRGLTTGSFNTGVGAGTLALNTADQNTATGAGALLFNTSGSQNTADGAFALFNNAVGSFNTATGDGALFSNTAGGSNTAIGWSALAANSEGGSNTAVGWAALSLYNSASNENTAVGTAALGDGGGTCNTAVGSNAGNLLVGNYNVAIGCGALEHQLIGDNNVGVGHQALAVTEGGSDNVGIGNQALALNGSGNSNTAIGAHAMFGSGLSSNSNTAIGADALFNVTEGGDANTAIGAGALMNNTSGFGNTAVGILAGSSITTADRVICIGNAIIGGNVSDSCYIGSIWDQPGGSQAVYVNSDGKLGFLVSSRRFKNDIEPMNQASEVIYSLKPVSFRYTKDIEPTRPMSFGLIAEDVEKVSAELVIRDAKGRPSSVRYESVNAMLLNEFLKEHKKVEEQHATIAELKGAIARLIARDEELAADLRKVSAWIEMSKPEAQVIAQQ